MDTDVFGTSSVYNTGFFIGIFQKILSIVDKQKSFNFGLLSI